MSNFWTYVRAEFTVEVVSKILFSGKFPRIVAFILVFLYLGFAIIRGIFRLIRAIWRLAYHTKFRRIKWTLREVADHGSKFDDTSRIDFSRNGFLGVILENPNYRRGIRQVCIWLDTSTEQLEIVLSDGQNAYILTYEQIRQFCPHEVALHRLYAISIFSHLRLNIL